MNNQCSFVGHIGKDPELQTFDDTGNQLVKFSIAVKEYSSKDDEDKTLWLDVEAWNGLAERVLNTITKGREVVIFGKLSINVYSKEVNGAPAEIKKPVIKLTSFHLCGRKPSAQTRTHTRKLASVKG